MRIGFIGVGGIASNYLRSLARLQQPIVAVSDINSERGAAVAREHTAAHYANHREMLRREKLDAVRTLAVTLAANRSLETGQVERVERG